MTTSPPLASSSHVGWFRPVSVVRPAAPRRIGRRYEPLEVVAEGGVARVWKAIDHARGGRFVAAKRLKSEHTFHPGTVRMFEEEARICRRFDHPNLVRATDWCHEVDGARTLILEWVDGLDLWRTIVAANRVGGLGWDEATTIVRRALRGLVAAHETKVHGRPCPVLHRDVSPENILLTRDGAVKLTDFGIARAADRRGYATEPGALMGKLPYMAPEQFGSGPVTERTDVYAMAVVLYEAIVGRRAFMFPTIAATAEAVRAGAVPPLDAVADVPRPLANAVARAMSPDPADRPESARRFELQLASILALLGGRDVDERLCEAVEIARAHHGQRAETRPARLA